MHPLAAERWLLTGRSTVAGVAGGKRQARALAVDAWAQASCSGNSCAGLPWTACDDGLATSLDVCNAITGCESTTAP